MREVERDPSRAVPLRSTQVDSTRRTGTKFYGIVMNDAQCAVEVEMLVREPVDT